jgi:hypothetical protein
MVFYGRPQDNAVITALKYLLFHTLLRQDSVFGLAF